MNDLDSQQGHSVEWGWIQCGPDRSIGYTVKVDDEEINACLHALAAYFLPPNTRYEIRERCPQNYGRTRGRAWFHIRTFADAPSWGSEPIGYNHAGGYYLRGQFTTPSLAARILPALENGSPRPL